MIFEERIPGTPGKASGNHAEPGEFEQEFYLTNRAASALLRDLAQEIEAGRRVEAVSGSWSVGINPLSPIKLEVQYKSVKKEDDIDSKKHPCHSAQVCHNGYHNDFCLGRSRSSNSRTINL